MLPAARVLPEERVFPEARVLPAPRGSARAVGATPRERTNHDGAGHAHQSRQGGISAPRGRKPSCAPYEMAPQNLCPEAHDAACCVCGGSEATDDNDLALCDNCDRGFHQRCHNPRVAHFGSPDDQWFCGRCVAELADSRGLRSSVGDFVWARLGTTSPPWPAQIVKVDFSTATDPKPFWVQFFDVGKTQGAWLSEHFVQPWSEGPKIAGVKDAKRRRALELAKQAGAEDLDAPRTSEAQSETPLPARPRADTRPGVASETPSKRKREQQELALDVGREAEEIQSLLAKARGRQQKLQAHLGTSGHAD